MREAVRVIPIRPTLDTVVRAMTVHNGGYCASDTQLHRIVPIWLAAHKRKWSRDQRTNRERCLQRVVHASGVIEIAEINVAWVRLYVATRRRQDARDATIIMEVAALQMLLHWCLKRGIIGTMPTNKVRISEYGLLRRPYEAGPWLKHLARIHLEVMNDAQGR